MIFIDIQMKSLIINLRLQYFKFAKQLKPESMTSLKKISIFAILLLIICVSSQQPNLLTEDKAFSDINELQASSEPSKTDTYMVSLLSQHEKQLVKLKVANQELLLKLEAITNRLDQQDKKNSDLTNENANFKLANQDLKAKLDALATRLDQQQKKVGDLTSDSASSKLANQELKARIDIFNNRLNLEEKMVNDLVNQNAKVKASVSQIQNQVNGVKQDVLTTIQNNGLRIGNRWVMKEEGSNSYQALVFRDLNCGRDCRYAFFAGRYRDP